MSSFAKWSLRSALAATAAGVALTVCAIGAEPASAKSSSSRYASHRYDGGGDSYNRFLRRKWRRALRRACRTDRHGRSREATTAPVVSAPSTPSAPTVTNVVTVAGSSTGADAASAANNAAAAANNLAGADGAASGAQSDVASVFEEHLPDIAFEQSAATESLVANGVISIEDFIDLLSGDQDSEAASASITASRTAMTVASLPQLSKRLGGGAIQGNPSMLSSLSTHGGGAPAGGFFGGAAPQRGMSFSGVGSSREGSFSFSGDLSSIKDQFASLDPTAAAAAFGSGAAGDVEGLLMAPTGRQKGKSVDLWFGGSYSYFNSDAGGIEQSGGVGTLQVGADTRLNEDLLVGVALFGDVLRSETSAGSRSEGLGVMAGPYAVVTLADSAYLELMGAYGRAFNSVDSFGLGEARYESERVLLTGRLSGDWEYQGWTIRPSTRVTYYSERQESFDAGDGSVVAAETTSLGEARAGPEFAYEFFWEGGALRPHLAFEGVWAFERSESAASGSGASAGQELSGSLSLGFDAMLGETSIRAGGRYDGIGDSDVSAVTGELVFRIPFD